MEIKRQLIRLLFVGTFLLPILTLVFFLEWNIQLKPEDVWKYFSQSFMQALLSTFFIGFLGLLFCVGLIGLSQSRYRNWVMALSVLPAFAPTIFIVISFQTWVDLLQMGDIRGVLLVSIVHSVMNLGLAGTLFFFLLESGLRSQASLAYLEGASRFRILKELLSAKQIEILIILLSFFGLCFTSFAIPLVLGGSQGATLEILAYRLLSEQGDLLGAFLIMALQWVCFYFLLQPLSGHLGFHFNSQGSLPHAIGIKWISLVGFAAAVLSLGGMLFGIPKGLQQLGDLLRMDFQLAPLLLNSIALALMAAALSFVLYMIMAYLWADTFLHKFSIGFGSVSSVLLGLGFFVMPIPNLIKLGLGLTVLFFPFAYRIFGSASLVSLTRQCEVADLLGASSKQRFVSIVLPQVMPSALRLSGVVAFWAIGEYAFSTVVTGELFNLGLLAKSFMLGYQLELATVLNWIILLTGGLIFLGFIWGADVCRRKLEV